MAVAPPGLPAMGWTSIMSVTGIISKWFIFGANKTEVVGLENLTTILDERHDNRDTPQNVKSALITVSNHISVLDDPLTWGIIPFKYFFQKPIDMRWGMGSEDLMFRNKFMGAFFSRGQCLPVHRLLHSPEGGLFQPIMNTAIAILSPYPSTFPSLVNSVKSATESTPQSTNLEHVNIPYRMPSWLHIYPEARVHQHPALQLRYFRWGISRFILELPSPPIILPMFISGFQDVMHEARTFPRFLPRVGKHVRIIIGEPVPVERWSGVRQRWNQVKEKCDSVGGEEGERMLREGKDAVELRIEVAKLVRGEVNKIREAEGYPPEEPESGLAETYAAPIMRVEGRQPGGVYEKEQ